MIGGRRGGRAFAALAAVAALAGISAYGAAADRGGAPHAGWTQNARTTHEGGKNVTVVYGGTVNYRDAQGEWQPIDDTLVPSSASRYAFENKADGYTVRFPADLAAAPIQLSVGSATVGFALHGAHGHVAASGATARVAGALDGTSASYTATPQGARELLTLASQNAPQSFTYDLRLGDGVTAQQLGPRAIAFVQDAKPVALFVAPSMHDASGASSSALTVALQGDSITVTPDASWLASSARAWPVTIDPDVLTMQGANQDTYIESGSPDTYFGGDPLLRVGYNVDPQTGASTVIRGLLNFQLDMNLPAGATVDSAQLALNQETQSTAAFEPVQVYNVIAPWSDATWNQYDWDYQTRGPIYWSTPGGDVDSSVVATATPTGPGTTTTWDVTQLVQKQVSGLDAPYGFLLRAQDETVNQVDGFTSSWSYDGNPLPTLTVTWESGSSTSGPAVSILTGTGENFGSWPVGTTSPTQEVDLSNSGNATLTVSSLGLGGTNPGDFAIVGSTCTNVAPGATCAITLSAKPTAVGTRSGTLVITDNAPGSPQNVALTVTGTAPASASVSPSSLSFGSVRVGTTSSTRYVTVTSTGGTTLSITGVSRTGANPGDFVISYDSCSGAQLANGQSCMVGVRARPKARGTRTAALRITSNVAGGSQSVPLSVTGA